MTQEKPQEGKRWKAFQCPACFGLFRLRSSQTGREGHCPTCDRVIAVPAAEEPAEAAPVRTSTEPAPDLLNRVSVAQPMTEEEKKEREASRRKKQHDFVTPAQQGLDWEENEEKTKKKIPLLAIGIVTSALVLLGAVGVKFIQDQTAQKAGKGDRVAKVSEEDYAVIAEAISTVAAPADLEASEALAEEPEFDLDQVEATVSRFLSAQDIDEMASVVRHPERVRPLMVDFYQRNDFEIPGFDSMDRRRFQHNPEPGFYHAFVVLGDFKKKILIVEKVERGEGGADYLVDWESFVGYSEFSAEELRQKRPTTPFLLRVVVSPEGYYNFEFSDDRIWSAYRLKFPSDGGSVLGYAKREGDAHKLLQRNRRVNKSQVTYTLMGKYPKNATAKDQIEIIEILNEGWVIYEE